MAALSKLTTATPTFTSPSGPAGAGYAPVAVSIVDARSMPFLYW
jgi:hypothetical protein